jgi:O-antigen ligase
MGPRQGSSGDGRLAAAALVGLVLLLPFEPRDALRVGGFGLTLLEAGAAVAALVLAWAGRGLLLALVRRPPLPLLALGAFAMAHMLSAVLAPEQNARAAKFALRMVAMAGFAVLVAAAPPEARKKGLHALVLTTLVVAGLALAEGLGARWLDPLLALFREMPFNVAGARRASAGSEYPNQAAAFLMCGLLALAGLSCARPRALRVVVPLSAALVGGLLFTYSRGALAATGVGLVAQAVVLGRRGLRSAVVPLAVLGVVIGVSVVFARTEEVFRLRVGSEGTDAWYAATYEPAERSLDLQPGEAHWTRIRVTNTGRKAWIAGPAFHLSYHWIDPALGTTEDGGRTRLPGDLGPGASVMLEAEVTAPRAEGRYLLAWDMVHEHTTWFSAQGVRAVVVPARIASVGSALPAAPPDAAFVDPSLAWRPSRAELWALAAGMWAERPWTGIGSDSFRWTYGSRAARRYWDRRVFANDTLLEVGATTGTFGAAALVLTLAAAGFAAARGSLAGPGGSELVASGIALFGLVLALAAHGVVDYLLAFTGHYLLFAFVVGSSAALPGEVR